MTRRKIIKYAVVAIAAATSILAVCAALLAWSGLCDDIHRADVALVLGNTVQPDGAPSLRLKARLDRTLELYRDGYFPMIIVSGGIGKEGHDEAAVMKDYLAAGGIPKEAIITDNEGDTTYASAKNTLRILHERNLGSVLVISQFFHIPRARLALTKFGVPAVYSAHARYFEARDIYSTLREVPGWIQYRFRSYDVGGKK